MKKRTGKRVIKLRCKNCGHINKKDIAVNYFIGSTGVCEVCGSIELEKVPNNLPKEE
jgi:hypothetical protein